LISWTVGQMFIYSYDQLIIVANTWKPYLQTSLAYSHPVRTI